jgi:hypothetical protein
VINEVGAGERMKAFCCRVKAWVKDGSDYWIMIIPFGLCLIFFLQLRQYDWGLDTFRVIGIAMEIFGLWTVVRSLTRDSRAHGQIGYHRSLLNWLYDAKYMFISRSGVFGAAISTGGAVMGGLGLISTSMNFNNIEEKVEYLLKRVVELQQGIDNNRNFIEQVKMDLKSDIDTVKAKVEQEIGNLKNKLKEKATFDYYLLISGAWLTVAGMLITNMPDSFMKLIFKSTG